MKNVLSLILIFSSVFVSFAQNHALDKLNYPYNALEPHIDAQTMEIHYSRHHQAYLTNLNKALEGNKAASLALEDLLLAAERRGNAIRNNGGGHYNHNLFWSILSPTPQKTPDNKLGMAITETFKSVDTLRALMNKEAMGRFGSGWVWLYVTPQKKLAVSSTPNQDNPIMDAAGNNRGIPILGIDVWEHAYYLKYQNKRADYLGGVWNVLDWKTVSMNYEKALSSPLLKTIEKDMWKELKEFHMVMGQTFHPMEEGNLEPIRKRSGEMFEKAKVLAAGAIPASFDNAKVRKAISDLVSGSSKLNGLIRKKAKDATIKTELTKLHDTFHIIQELCSE